MWKGYVACRSPSRCPVDELDPPRIRQRALPRVPAGAARAHRGRRLLGLARDDARRGGAPDARARAAAYVEVTASCAPPVTPPSASSTTSAFDEAHAAARPPRRRESSSCCSTSPMRAAGSSASGRSRSAAYLRELEELRAAGSASASPPTPSARARPTGSRSSAATPPREGLPLHVHADEQPREIEECLAEHGAPPDRAARASGLPRPAHDGRARDARRRPELDLLAAAGARVCACPTTEANLGDGFLPVERLLHRGIGLCIGSDSNVRIDPLEELRELDGIARRQSGRRDVFSVDALLEIGAGGGARAGPRALGRRRGRPLHRSLRGPGDPRAALVHGCSAEVLA